MVKAYTYRFSLLCLAISLLMVSCKKVELPDPDHEGVRYELTGELDGEPFYLGIGSPEIEMVPHHNLDEHDVWQMSGTLRSKEMSRVPNFRLSLRNYEQGGEKRGEQTEVLSGPHSIYHSEGVSRLMHPLHLLVKNYNGLSIDSIRIDQKDNYEGREETILHFDRQSPHQLTLRYSYPGVDGCYLTTHVRANSTDDLVIANWHVYQQNSTEATLRVHLNGADISDYSTFKWSTGETGREIVVQQGGWYSISITNQSNQTFVHHKYLHRTNEGDFTTYGHDISIDANWQNPEMITDLVQTGAIDLEYQDENGVSYRPIANPNEDPRVTISKINLPRHHPSGTLSFDIVVSFTCTMENDAGEQIHFRDVEGIIAIGVPE